MKFFLGKRAANILEVTLDSHEGVEIFKPYI